MGSGLPKEKNMDNRYKDGKTPASFRFSNETHRKLNELAEGITKTEFLVRYIDRAYARKEKRGSRA